MRAIACAAACLAVSGIPTTAAYSPPLRPKLVVVIVIDQFRFDYPQRFRPFFTGEGFNLFFKRGAVFSRARYEHGVLFTCPGHSVVLTGSYADANGIVSNFWYDAAAGREIYCASDTAASLVGAAGEGRSPHYLIDSTLGDVLKQTSRGTSRVIAIAGKDRSAIMLGGHLADGVYWTQDTLLVTSSYYHRQLPEWVHRFNASGRASGYLGKPWNRLLPATAYAGMGPDDVANERDVAGVGRTFPHLVPARSSHQNLIEAFENSPFHNELLSEFAMQAVVQESLGTHQGPDLLALGFSANDIIGHTYGPDSHEVMDVTVRTDRLLDQFFRFLDHRIGLANVAIVITGDHGVAPFPELMRQRDPSADAARLNPSVIQLAVEAALDQKYGGSGWIADHEYPFIYLNVPALRRAGIALDQAEQTARDALKQLPSVRLAVTAGDLERQRRRGEHSNAERSFFPGRSGDIYYQLGPYVIPQTRAEGTTHGGIWPYDTDVPLLWFGADILPGYYKSPAYVDDIAPTLSALLHVAKPSGSEGKVLKEILR